MNRIFICLFGALLAVHAQAQSGFPDYLTTNTYLNNYVQPAPNVAALGKYADYPVSYYTGVPDISIPLFDLKDGAAHMPISLSYHASGIKVSETASWAGLGWALNAGGMITRAVRGAPDEGSGFSWGGGTGPRGYYIDYGLSLLPLLPYPGEPADFQPLSSYPIQPIAAGYMDTEPDLFTFNFNGRTGKFVFDENRIPRLLTDDNMKISVNFNGTTFTSWEITTEDGAMYYFGENNTYEVMQPSSYLNGGIVDRRSNYPSTWYLTRVVYPNTKDTIYLDYTPEKYLYRDLAPEHHVYAGTNISQFCINFLPNYDILQTTIQGQRLTNVKSRNYNVVLVANNQRQDLSAVYGGASANSLDSVNIYTSAGQCLKRYALTYTYFTSPLGSTTSAISSLASRLQDATDTKRLQLVSLTEYSGDLSLSKPPYLFNYDVSLSLPRRLSYDQDHWGYSNNHLGYINPFFTPSVDLPGCSAYALGSANRTPQWPDMRAFTLISMVDPLGVTTNFTYEAHSASIGGLRIQQITATDSVTGSVKVRSFTYSTPVLFNAPQYVVLANNEFFSTFAEFGGAFVYGGFYQGYSYAGPYQQIITHIIKQGQSIVPLQDVQGNHVGYAWVRETFGARGEGGSNYYQFQTNGAGNEDSRLDMNNYTAYGSYLVDGVNQSGLTGNGLFQQVLPQNLQYHTGYSGTSTQLYPFAPNQVSFGRGRMGAELTYDSAGNLLHSVYNSYAITFHENYWLRGLKILPPPTIISESNPNVGYTFYKLHTGISHLVSSVITDYKDGRSLTTTTRYGYESAYHTLKTSDTTTNSIGDSLIKKTYYSFDYASSATPDGIFGKMYTRNLLTPVATRIWKNGNLIGGTVTQYYDFATDGTDTFANPLKIYSMETTVPLTPAQAGEGIALTGQLTTLLPDGNFVEKADFSFNGTTGRGIGQKLVNDKDQALIWDNQLGLPLAQVDNAYFTDVAFTSFETAEMGNWVFTSSSVVSDATAPTGAYAYALSSGSPITRSSLNTAQTYIVSYWLKSGAGISISGGTQSGNVTGRTLNGWTYHELKLTGTASISITGSGNVDELRLYPSTAQMTTYTYDPLMRLMATGSVNSTISYYQYDALNRLTDIKDQFGNITKAFEYNYGRQSR